MILHGDCLEVLRAMPADSVDSICTDPPYGISFMAKKWDYDVPSVEVWRECLRVLKPGGHMLVACGTRTQHRMVVNMEDAGFEIRDVVTWHYGQGFPKSLDVSKAIDKEAGATREVTGPKATYRKPQAPNGWDCTKRAEFETAPATDAAREWEGWGTALKPACEFWTLCRKPLSEPTVAKNVLKWGTGALNIDGCRVSVSDADAEKIRNNAPRVPTGHEGFDRPWKHNPEKVAKYLQGRQAALEKVATEGRFPANLILDEEAAAALDAQSGISKSSPRVYKDGEGDTEQPGGWKTGKRTAHVTGATDSGGASRFFYIAKSSKKDRGEGNIHPTCKPTTLMAYLCRLITPPGGLVLDPFTGSGSTGVGALREGFRFLGIEREEQYAEIARGRLEAAS